MAIDEVLKNTKKNNIRPVTITITKKIGIRKSSDTNFFPLGNTDAEGGFEPSRLPPLDFEAQIIQDAIKCA